MQRREFLGAVTASLVASATAVPSGQAAPAAQATPPPPPPRKGRIKQGVTRGVFGRGAVLDDACRQAARLGIKGYDLRGPADWPTLKKYGLVPSMYQPAGTDAASITNALNRKENHERMDRSIRGAIDESAAAGVPNVITFSGNRGTVITDTDGADNCVAFLNNIKGYAEQKGVTICMELLNSKVNHRGYM